MVIFAAVLVSGCDNGDDILFPNGIGGGDDDSFECVASISDVSVRTHPDNALAFYASWTTPEPASSRVEFGRADDGLDFVIEDDNKVTDHEVFVFGMKPETEYMFAAVSIMDSGEEAYCSEELGFTSGTVPFAGADAEVTVYDRELAYHGWTLGNFLMADNQQSAWMVIWDMDGDPVWYYDYGLTEGRSDQEVTLVYDGDKPRILIGGGVKKNEPATELDLEWNVTWEGPVQSDGMGTEGDMHHCMHRTSTNNYVALFHAWEDSSTHTEVREFDRELNVLWSWMLYQHTDWDGYDMGNHVIVDYEDDAVYYNEQLSKGFYKIDRSTGEVIWKLGEDGDFEVINSKSDEDFGYFTHAPELLPDDRLLIFHNGSDQSGSAAIEWQLDFGAMTATAIWSWNGGEDDGWYNYCWGDVDRLPNGNTLVTAGTPDPPNREPRLMEVAPDEELVWELRIYDTDPDFKGSYMSERIPVLVGEK
ncbi:MAG: aryl-sulfate sulfotransferase [Candidatus Kerfeldbacteria bacterium]